MCYWWVDLFNIMLGFMLGILFFTLVTVCHGMIALDIFKKAIDQGADKFKEDFGKAMDKFEADVDKAIKSADNAPTAPLQSIITE
eukprot:04477.XXX_40409_40016_1 [CDS] Oithona nana genome sequencing.